MVNCLKLLITAAFPRNRLSPTYLELLLNRTLFHIIIHWKLIPISTIKTIVYWPLDSFHLSFLFLIFLWRVVHLTFHLTNISSFSALRDEKTCHFSFLFFFQNLSLLKVKFIFVQLNLRISFVEIWIQALWNSFLEFEIFL